MANYLDVEQACVFLHCKKNYLYQLIHKRQIPFYKPNRGRILFDADELDAFVRAGRVATHEELEGKAVELLNSRGAK